MAVAWADEGQIVRSILIEGNRRVEKSTIEYYIKTQVGKPLSQSQVRKDIEEIYALGQFKDIRVETVPVAGGVNVIFRIEEILSIGEIHIEGNDQVDSVEIWKKIKDFLKQGATFHPHLLIETKETVTNFFHEKGYFFAEVSIDTEPTEDNLVNITINIQREAKVGIEKIRFIGNKQFTDDELIGQMETKAKTWYSWLDESGIYKKDLLKLDTFRIESFYQDHGFIKVRVLEPKIDINRKDKEIYIVIPLEEGKQFRIGKVEVQGNDILNEDDIYAAIKSKPGDVYNLSQVREDVLSISELYSKAGYAYADVNPKVVENDEQKTVDLTMEIDKGRKVYVGEILISGNTRTKDNVIRRQFRLKEGDLFDSDKLKRSKQRINNTRFFADVKVDTRRGKEPDLIDVVTTVTEQPTGSISVGAGFSSVENLIFNASISQDNFLGGGQKVIFSTNLSSVRSDFNLSLTEPHILDSDIMGGIDLFNTETDFFSFESKSTGGGLRIGKNISEYENVSLLYKYEAVKISGVDPGEETTFLRNENRTSSRIAPSYTYDNRDDFLNPTTGWRHVVRFDFAGSVLGGSDFVKTNYEVTYYQSVIGKLVAAVHAEVGWADGYNGESLPVFERYFMGGPASLRGYTIRDIGPKDKNNDPIGGEQSLLFNFELQYPFTKGLRGFVFYDRGNVYGSGTSTIGTTTNIDLSEMRSSIGGGIRFISPFGPVGFAYGIKLDKREGEKDAEFHFSAGSAF
ncbi:MAG: outer membrane protein assembly factor BamA [Candidatus Nitrohelix vancouverensis]|uniref:Outer membrane protein assembly factor BamA n=1 Tax=Candidatus Nitrohelix vancouverensis TaxID=2705534 RepID=A0A7T0BZT7_9BACT|nr:MAG: outer membrane protein assembly factor BamA [Candidatus Nitrohelix vancouverensis]